MNRKTRDVSRTASVTRSTLLRLLNSLPLWLQVAVVFLFIDTLVLAILWLPCALSFGGEGCVLTGFGLIATQFPFLVPAVELGLVPSATFWHELGYGSLAGLIGYTAFGLLVGILAHTWQRFRK